MLPQDLINEENANGKIKASDAPKLRRSNHDTTSQASPAVSKSPDLSMKSEPKSLKRKRDQPELKQPNAKLDEYLGLMGAKRGTNIERVGFDSEGPQEETSERVEQGNPVEAQEHESDNEYQSLARTNKRGKTQQPQVQNDTSANSDTKHEADEVEVPSQHTDPLETDVPDVSLTGPAQVSDADWLRSRTSRLLGLLNEDEESEVPRSSDAAPTRTIPSRVTPPSGEEELSQVAEDEAGPLPQEKNEEKQTNADEDSIHSTCRLFLRNLAYDVQEDDLRDHFSKYGELEEVRCHSILERTLPIRDESR